MLQYQKNELLLRATDISLKYDDKQILQNVNFEIHDITRPNVTQGQVVSLIGRSGIGKTQLFKIIAGLITPTTGNIKIGKDQHDVVAGEVGVIPQNYILFNHRSIYTNLKIGLDNSDKKHSDSEAKSIIEDYASKFDLSDHLKKFPAQLSGGQRQRVSIIQQVLTGNKFILLDEPFSGLDPIMIDKINTLLLKISTLNEENTLIIVSHDIENTLALSDTAFILAQKPGVQGATITEVLDLISLDFCWNPDIKSNHAFQEFVNNVKHKI